MNLRGFNPKRILPFAAAALVWLVLALGLAACGDDNATTPAATPTVASATADIRVTVSFQVGPTVAGAIERHVTGVEKATIEVRGFNLVATTDENGQAEFSNIPVSSDTDKPTRVDVVVTAPGYGTFTYLSVPLWPNNGAILTPTLAPEPRVDDLGQQVPPLRNTTPSAAATPQISGGLAARCPVGWFLHEYPDAGYSVCIPPGWAVIDYGENGAEGTHISIFDPDLAPFAGQPKGGTVPGGVKMGIRVAPPSEPYDRSTFDDPTACSRHTVEEISGKQVDVCTTYATDPQLLPRDRFAPGEEKGMGWVFPSINGATLIAGAGFDSPVSAEDDAAVAQIVESIRQ
jgi:hypothetical protein